MRCAISISTRPGVDRALRASGYRADVTPLCAAIADYVRGYLAQTAVSVTTPPIPAVSAIV